MPRPPTLTLLACSIALAGCAARTPLDQPPPGTTAEPFAPHLWSGGTFTLNSAFTPDGGEFFFTRRIGERLTMFRTVRSASGWSEPTLFAPFADPGDKPDAVDMMVSPDGRELWFAGSAPNDVFAGDSRLDLWVAQRTGDGWGPARMLPEPWSSAAQDVYPCIVGDGSLWFSSQRDGGLGGGDLYRSQRLADGSFAAPENVGAPLNSAVDQGDTFVAADESWLVVTMPDESGAGQSDLHVAFRTADGTWTAPVNLGPAVNSDGHDYCPMRSPDGRYLLFSRRWGPWNAIERSELAWVDIAVLERFRPSAE